MKNKSLLLVMKEGGYSMNLRNKKFLPCDE